MTAVLKMMQKRMKLSKPSFCTIMPANLRNPLSASGCGFIGENMRMCTMAISCIRTALGRKVRVRVGVRSKIGVRVKVRVKVRSKVRVWVRVKVRVGVRLGLRLGLGLRFR